jgi:hypothetical protein
MTAETWNGKSDREPATAKATENQQRQSNREPATAKATENQQRQKQQGTSNGKSNSGFLHCDAHGETVGIFGRNDDPGWWKLAGRNEEAGE